jgi:hypothetical protein
LGAPARGVVVANTTVIKKIKHLILKIRWSNPFNLIKNKWVWEFNY